MQRRHPIKFGGGLDLFGTVFGAVTQSSCWKQKNKKINKFLTVIDICLHPFSLVFIDDFLFINSFACIIDFRANGRAG